MSLKYPDPKAATRSKWRAILTRLGAPAKSLTGRHAPCPICGGKDRFRFTDAGGDGVYVCNQCGSGDGFALAQSLTGKEFKDVLGEVMEIAGVAQEHKRETVSDEYIRKQRAAIWSASSRMAVGDPSDLYLRARVGTRYVRPDPQAIRTIWKESTNEHDVMVAVVRNRAGGVETLHRTYLDGEKKADMNSPRRMAPGKFEPGSAIRLYPIDDWQVLGVAEGIETAVAASSLHDVPVWSLMSAENMQKFTPPAGITTLIIFGDNDHSFTGQTAAYALANKLHQKLNVMVKIPPKDGQDWCDVSFWGLG